MLRVALTIFCVLYINLSGAAYAVPDCIIEQPNSVDFTCLRQWYSQPSQFWPAANIDPEVEWQELAALPKTAPAPATNPYTEDKRALGEKLFFDPNLSRSQQVSCATCHEPRLAFADARRVSLGHQGLAGRRNAPSVVASSLINPLFWDGRRSSLEDQALGPIEDPVEMAFSLAELEQRLAQDTAYIEQFSRVFNGPPSAKHVAQALATYQRSLLPRDSDFERFMQGNTQALSDQALWGMHLFRTQARCMNCHQGAALSDQKFHNLGLTFYGRKYEDLGRYEVTQQVQDVGAFRTPSLRWVSKTGPWMHNGLFPELDGVLNMYNAGMPTIKATAEQESDPLFPQKSKLLQPLHLNQQQLAALKAFLQAL